MVSSGDPLSSDSWGALALLRALDALALGRSQGWDFLRWVALKLGRF